MILIIIYGPVAVGKLTVANELSKKTGFAVLHNHLVIDLAVKYFEFGTEPFTNLIKGIRMTIINELIINNTNGLILTSGFSNNRIGEEFYERLEKLVVTDGGSVFYVKLVCDLEERKRRVKSEERRKYFKPSELDYYSINTKYLDFSTEIARNNTLEINNTSLSPELVAKQIMNNYKIDGIEDFLTK
jgi:deoxyadenosine/deoxycytidine kinase